MTPKRIIGSINITLDDARVLPAGPPHTYLGVAEQLLNGVDPLVAAGGPCAVPLAFVGGQVAECALKASLSNNGDDTRLRNTDLRHILAELWKLAQSEGLPIDPKPPPWLERLSQLHERPYYIRYSKGVQGLVIPAPAEIQAGLKALVQTVGRHIKS